LFVVEEGIRKIEVFSAAIRIAKEAEELVGGRKDVAVDGLPVTIRLFDPPLYEFVPRDPNRQNELAASPGIRPFEIEKRGEALHETNPMMGHRGVGLGIV
jgi:phosphoenolpyruvate synthase/pyruvate phosphate dikinase